MTKYWIITWPNWLMVLSWVITPVLFNPLAFSLKHVQDDVRDFWNWMKRKEGDSWLNWFNEEYNYVNELSLSRRSYGALLSLRHGFCGLVIFAYREINLFELLVPCVGILFICTLAVLNHLSKKSLQKHRILVRYATVAVILGFIGLFLGVLFWFDLQIGYYELKQMIYAVIGMCYVMITLTTISMFFGYKVVYLFRLFDMLLCSLMLGIIYVLALLSFPNILQTRLLFHSAFDKYLQLEQALSQSPKITEKSQSDENYKRHQSTSALSSPMSPGSISSYGSLDTSE